MRIGLNLSRSMLTQFYIEALLVDEGLADQVWEAWISGMIDHELASIAWLLVAALNPVPDTGHK